jgi:hypothetical protein
MKVSRWVVWVGFFLVALFSAAGCTLLPGLVSTSSAILPTQSIGNVQVPDAALVVRAYLDAWKAEDYPKMYSFLTSLSRDAISEEEFVSHYQSVAAEAALTIDGITTEIKSVMVNPDTAQANYRVTLNSLLVGEITRDTTMNLSLEKGEWRVATFQRAPISMTGWVGRW